MKRLLYVLPLLVFAALGVFLWRGLHEDPSIVPSALINKPAPAFALAPLGSNQPGLASTDLTGHVTLVSYFASWCVPCQAEHPLLMGLQAQNKLRLVGIDYKDKPTDARAWLARMGNPYAAIGTDLDGRVGIDFGVYGVPETYLVDKTGTIRFKQVGPLTEQVITDKILPMAVALAK